MARTHHRYSDELLAEHLAVGKTVAAAARAAGISERTAYRRKKHPAVRDRIAEVHRAALDTASGQLHQGMVVACDTLTGLIGHANPHVQIRAAQTVIQLALKVRQAVDVADRLDLIAEPARPSPVAPVCPDTGTRPTVLGPNHDLTETDWSDRPRIPEYPTPDGAASPPTGPASAPIEIGLTTGEDDRGRGVGLDRRPRPDRTARMVAVVGVLLLLAGLPCAFAGATRARNERGPAADGTLPICQNLTEPATGAAGRSLAVTARCTMPPGAFEHPAAGIAPSYNPHARIARAMMSAIRASDSSDVHRGGIA